MAKQKVNIWLDNNRPIPDGWRGYKTVASCMGAIMSLNLETTEFDILSLDHDLGEGNQTGTDFCKAFVRHPDRFPNTIYLHTANPKGKERMEDLLKRCIKENNLKTKLIPHRLEGTISPSRIDG
jgi:23S rRNA (cytidine2498-2'-O)-methyltransferase